MVSLGKFRRCLAITALAASLQFGWSGVTVAQDAAEIGGSFLLGTASTGGTYHPVGVALSTLIKLKLLPELNVDMTAVNTEGSRENVELLGQNDIQFAIISALAGHDARKGVGQFAGAAPDQDLRAITTLWLSTDHLLVRDNEVTSGTIDDFLSLEGQPVSLGRPDSGTLLGNQTMMAALGVNVESDFETVDLGYGESVAALANGSIDGVSLSGGLPIAAVQEAFDQMGKGVALLGIDDQQLARIDRGRGLWQRVVIPGGTYAGQDEDVLTIGSPNILAVRADVDEEVVYQITKTVFEELEYLHGLHGATRQISLDNAINNLPLPIHEGALRYFEEKGVESPPPPVELDDNLLVRYPSVEQARADANDGVVTLFTGSEGETSSRIATDLAAVINGTSDDVRLLSTFGGGIGRNLTDLLFLKGVDTALVRADTLNYALDQNVYPTLQNQVTYISEMHAEEVHLLVRSDIDNLAGLVDQKIDIGAPGSGTDITASIVLAELGLNAEVTRYGSRQAIEMLKRGEIAGAFLVGGKPMPFLEQIEDGSGLKFLALPAIDFRDSYRQAELVAGDYPNLMNAGDALSTIAVRTALLTYAWRSDSLRYEALSAFTDALFTSLLTLHQDGYHAKWREIDPTAEMAGWNRFGPAARWISDNEGTARRIIAEGQLLQNDDGSAGQTSSIADGDGQAPVQDDNLDAALVPADGDAASSNRELLDEPPAVDILPVTTVPSAPVVVEPSAVEQPDEVSGGGSLEETVPEPTPEQEAELPTNQASTPSSGVSAKTPTF